jgi:hypothetical protein
MLEVSESQRIETNINDIESGVAVTSGVTPRSGAKKRPKLQSITIERKLEVIKWHKENGSNVSQTQRHFGYVRSCIRDWVRKEEEFQKVVKTRGIRIKNRRRLPKERKPKFPDVDTEVIQWFHIKRKSKLVVTSDLLMAKALDVFEKSTYHSDGQTFSASWGWLNAFLERNRLTSRTVTSVGQKIPADALDISRLFFDRIEKFREQQLGSDYNILNMDEMPVCFDSPQNRTYDTIGSKSVQLKTTGNEKLRFTLMLCAYNDGRKCEPAIIFKGLKKVPKKERFPKGIKIMVSAKGSVNGDLMNEWRTSVYKGRPGGYFFNFRLKRTNGPKYRTLLAIDAATPHRSNQFKKLMAKHHDTRVEIIPSGMTPLLQPADLSWNRSVKSSVKKQWSEWMGSPKDPKELNKKGIAKRPAYALVAQWCLKAWKELPTKQIIDSFLYCNMGPKRDDSALHSRLIDLLSTGSAPEPEEYEPTGLTDIESDDEEMQDIIVVDESIDTTDD